MGVVRVIVILLRAVLHPRMALAVRTVALPARGVYPRTPQQFSRYPEQSSTKLFLQNNLRNLWHLGTTFGRRKCQ
jgi:hypothetical protein